MPPSRRHPAASTNLHRAGVQVDQRAWDAPRTDRRMSPTTNRGVRPDVSRERTQAPRCGAGSSEPPVPGIRRGGTSTVLSLPCSRQPASRLSRWGHLCLAAVHTRGADSLRAPPAEEPATRSCSAGAPKAMYRPALPASHGERCGAETGMRPSRAPSPLAAALAVGCATLSVVKVCCPDYRAVGARACIPRVRGVALPTLSIRYRARRQAPGRAHPGGGP
jgi:hypothetical protein